MRQDFSVRVLPTPLGRFRVVFKKHGSGRPVFFAVVASMAGRRGRAQEVCLCQFNQIRTVCGQVC